MQIRIITTVIITSGTTTAAVSISIQWGFAAIVIINTVAITGAADRGANSGNAGGGSVGVGTLRT